MDRAEFEVTPPYAAFPLDQAARERLENDPVEERSVNSSSTIEHLTTYGRPLWMLWNSMRKYETLRNFAEYKLSNGTLEAHADFGVSTNPHRL